MLSFQLTQLNPFGRIIHNAAIEPSINDFGNSQMDSDMDQIGFFFWNQTHLTNEFSPMCIISFEHVYTQVCGSG